MSDTASFITKILEDFSTPSWGKTLLINNIEKFSDAELRTMRLFINDEMASRETAAKATAGEERP